jgi:hypothetical protein
MCWQCLIAQEKRLSLTSLDGGDDVLRLCTQPHAASTSNKDLTSGRSSLEEFAQAFFELLLCFLAFSTEGPTDD